MRTLVFSLGILSLLLPTTFAQNVEIMTVTDSAAATPGVSTVTKAMMLDLPAGPADVRSISQMPGFPVTIGFNQYFSPFRGAAFADLNNDGNLEILVANSEMKLYAFDMYGNAVPGFPFTTVNYAQYVPSVADMNGDGNVEIVFVTRGPTSGGRLYILNNQGVPLPNFPVSISNRNLLSAVTLYDFDGDGQLEILVPSRAYPIGYLHIFEMDGTEWVGNGWPYALDHVPACTPAVGDVTGDGNVEIVMLSYTSVHVVALDGTSLPGWPLSIAGANFSYQSPALADLDHDGDLEIIFASSGTVSGCHVYHHDATIYPGWPKLMTAWSYCPPTVTDLEGDGELEILCGNSGSGEGPTVCFWVWTADGVDKPGFPFMMPAGGSEGPITVADIDGDGYMEIFADYNIKEANDGNGWLFGLDYQGNTLPGFPLRPHGWTYLRGASIADVNNDGHYELACVTQHDTGIDVNLYTLSDAYAATSRDWKVYHARQTRGGWYKQCRGDLNGDGFVNLQDLAQLLAYYGTPSGATQGQGDMDGDGDVDLSDLAALLALYGTQCQ